MKKKDESVPLALRSVEITFNNKTETSLYLKKTEVSHGAFNPFPPEIVKAGEAATWKTEGSILTGTQALAYYGIEGSDIEFALYWDNPLVGSNSYSSTVNNNDGTYPVFAAGTAGNDSSVSFNAHVKRNWQYDSWMKDIDDDKSIALISVPGTHESCATYSPDGDILGIVICQDQSVTEQLQEGIRFLDIRCRAVDGIFAIHHGPVYQKINFDDVLNECIGFLSSSPSETVFMRIKQEYSEVSDAEFIRIFNEKYSSYHENMYLDSTAPSLGEARGKIVVLSNVSGLPGIPWYTMQIQDNYNPESIDAKKAAISEHLDFTIDNHSNGGDRIFINFISMQGTPASMTIKQAAQRLNPEFINMLNEKEDISGIGAGMIPMDFPNYSDGIVHGIIDSNY